jgi:hypothetical protein
MLNTSLLVVYSCTDILTGCREFIYVTQWREHFLHTLVVLFVFDCVTSVYKCIHSHLTGLVLTLHALHALLCRRHTTGQGLLRIVPVTAGEKQEKRRKELGQKKKAVPKKKEAKGKSVGLRVRKALWVWLARASRYVVWFYQPLCAAPNTSHLLTHTCTHASPSIPMH